MRVVALPWPCSFRVRRCHDNPIKSFDEALLTVLGELSKVRAK